MNGTAPALVLAAAFAACAAPGPAPGGPHTLDGAPVAPLQVPAGTVHVLVFVSQECPIANGYAPEIGALAAAWRAEPVRLFVVHVDPDLTPAAARAHAEAYALPSPIVLDPGQSLAAALGVTRTPEAAVLDAHGLRYRGRIDDAWGRLGARAEATHRDLRDAVAALLAGQPVAAPRTEAVGCLLPEPRR